MLKKTVTYMNFDDVEVTEDHYFNLTAAELFDRNVKANMSLASTVEAIGKTKDVARVFQLVSDIVDWAYGRREDGQFIKSPAISAAFRTSEAWSAMFFQDLMQNEGKNIAPFIDALIPKNLEEQLAGVTPTAREKSEAQMQGHQSGRRAAATTYDDSPNFERGDGQSLG